MSPPNLRVRRATTDDFQALRSLWNSMSLPADDLEKRLTEFQVIESGDGQISGAIGLQIVRQHALLHSEAYADFSLADEARQLFWERIQTIASHHGVFRLWTQENSPFWSRCGFRIVITESLVHLPEFVRVIGTAHHRAAGHVHKTHFLRRAQPPSAQIASGGTNSTTGKCFSVGCKYWPSVRMSHFAARKSSMRLDHHFLFRFAQPSIMPDLV
jgi:N-acetylglutamate synthase-like GNAT family acetyltransferase